MLRAPCLRGRPRRRAPSTPATNAGTQTKNAPAKHEEAPDPTVVAKLDGQAPTPDTLIAELDRPQHDRRRGRSRPTGTSIWTTGSRSPPTPPTASLIQRFGKGSSPPAAASLSTRATGEVLAAEAQPGPDHVFGPEATTARANRSTRVSSQNLTPSSTELRAEIDPRRPRDRIPLPVRHERLRRNPSACTESPPARSPPASATSRQRRSARRPRSRRPPTTTASWQATPTAPPKACPRRTLSRRCPRRACCPTGAAGSWSRRRTSTASTVEMLSALARRRDPGLAERRARSPGSRPARSSANRKATAASNSPSCSRCANREGWSTQSLETPHTKGWGLLLPSPSEYHFFSPDLSHEPASSRPNTTSARPKGSSNTRRSRRWPAKRRCTCANDLPVAGQFSPLVTAQQRHRRHEVRRAASTSSARPAT